MGRLVLGWLCGLFVACTAFSALAAGPPNDNFENALELRDRGQYYAFHGDGATVEPGEPLPQGIRHGGRTVWFTFKAARNGWAVLDISFFHEGAPIASVYTGGGLKKLKLQASRIVAMSGPNENGTVLFATTKGERYFIQLDSTYLVNFAVLALYEFPTKGGIAVAPDDPRFYHGQIWTSPGHGRIERFRAINVFDHSATVRPTATIDTIDEDYSDAQVPARNEKDNTAGFVWFDVFSDKYNLFGKRWGIWLRTLNFEARVKSRPWTVVESFPLVISKSWQDQVDIDLALETTSVSVKLGKPASIFLTAKNTGQFRAVGCFVNTRKNNHSLEGRAVDPVSREGIADWNEPVNIAPGETKVFEARALAREFASQSIDFYVSCANGGSVWYGISLNLTIKP
jgi:hypothetical protein